MAQTLILAKNITEANEYARAVGLERFSYRAVRSAGSIKGVRNAEVHLLPSFLARPDRHAILSVLSFARTLEVIYADPADFAPAEDSNALESGTPPTEREIEVAYRYHSMREAALAEKAALEELAKVADSPKVTEAVEAKVEHLDAGLEALVADQKVPAKTTRKSRQKAATPANDFF